LEVLFYFCNRFHELIKSTQYLTKEQRHELWRTGTFSVQSNKFPEQKHVWVITPLLIAGVENIRNSWYKGLAYTVNQFAIQTPARLFNTG
jgi:hypothetical protein